MDKNVRDCVVLTDFRTRGKGSARGGDLRHTLSPTRTRGKGKGMTAQNCVFVLPGLSLIFERKYRRAHGKKIKSGVSPVFQFEE